MKRPVLLTLFLFAAAPDLPLLAHEGHDHGPAVGEEVATGPITLPEEAIRNLEIKTVDVVPTPLQRTVTMVGRIEGLPERHAKIAPRAEGRVS